VGFFVVTPMLLPGETSHWEADRLVFFGLVIGLELVDSFIELGTNNLNISVLERGSE
jgi:hypothetical protein